MSRIYVDRYTGRLEKSDLYKVNLVLTDGRVIENLEPRRIFPLSNTTMYISLLDENECEVALVRDFSEIDEASRQVLEESFDEYYMIPEITRIVNIDDKVGAIKWTVETTRGRITFGVQDRHADVRVFWNKNRIVIRDKNDNRYEIKDFKKLDKHSLRYLFPYI